MYEVAVFSGIAQVLTQKIKSLSELNEMVRRLDRVIITVFKDDKPKITIDVNKPKITIIHMNLTDKEKEEIKEILEVAKPYTPPFFGMKDE